MQAGKLRHQITFEELTGALDTFGAETDTWEGVRTVWASVEPQVNQGKESFTTMDQLQALDISRITVRRQSVHGVTAKMRVKMYDIFQATDRYFDILGIQNVGESGGEATLTVKERK